MYRIGRVRMSADSLRALASQAFGRAGARRFEAEHRTRAAGIEVPEELLARIEALAAR